MSRTRDAAQRPVTRRRRLRARPCVAGPRRAAARRCPAATSTTRAAASCSRRSRELPEYYPTRTETAHPARARAPRSPRARRQRRVLVEFGAGSSLKTELLLAASPRPRRLRADRRLGERARATRARGSRDAFPALDVRAGRRRLHAPLRAARATCAARRALGFFPGSTIGNFDPPEAARAAAPHSRRVLGAGGAADRRRRSAEGPAAARARLRRRARRHGGLQPQPAGPHQPRTRRRLRPRARSATTASGTRRAARIEMHLVSLQAIRSCIAGRAHVPLSARRDDPHRELAQMAGRCVRRHLRGRGLAGSRDRWTRSRRTLPRAGSSRQERDASPREIASRLDARARRARQKPRLRRGRAPVRRSADERRT